MNTLPLQVRLRGKVAAIFVFSLIFACGCGGAGSKNTMLTGTVFYKDAPLTGGTITLYQADGQGMPTKTNIATDGAYGFVGVSPGEKMVVIETETLRGQTGSSAKATPGQQTPDMGTKAANYVQIPPIYGHPSNTPLRVTLNTGKNTQDFKLNESGK
jgi:hypothetical protein